MKRQTGQFDIYYDIFLQKERKYYAVDAGVYKQQDDYNVSYTITEAVIIVLS